MINEYFRPNSVEEVLQLLMESEKNRRPLGGGTTVSRQQDGLSGVVDLQQAGLDYIDSSAQNLQVGAAVRLAALLEHLEVDLEIKRAISIEANQNIRNVATLGGWVISGDGRSILSTLLLAMDSILTWEPENQRIHMGDWLPLRKEGSPGVLLHHLAWFKGLNAAFEYVARSPKDRPTLIVAAAQWGSGRTRIALGGYGSEPIVAVDGPDDSGVDLASQDAYTAADDQWATALYRREVAAKLALRCLDRINAMKGSEA